MYSLHGQAGSQSVSRSVAGALGAAQRSAPSLVV